MASVEIIGSLIVSNVIISRRLEPVRKFVTQLVLSWNSILVINNIIILFSQSITYSYGELPELKRMQTIAYYCVK